MEVMLAFTSGLLMASGLYSMLRKHLYQMIIGVMLLSHGANLMVFLTGGLAQGKPAFIPEGANALPPGSADPIPQALVLTAIVIGFGLTAFLLVLFKQCIAAVGSSQVDDFRMGEEE